VKAVVDPGEGPGRPGTPLFLDRSEARKAEQFFFWRLSPLPYLRPYPCSQGLDTALESVCVFFRHKSDGEISSTSQTGQASKSLDRWSVRKGNSVPEADANS